MPLTKAQILQGVKYVEEFHVEELDGEVKIRALSDGELSVIEGNHLANMGKIGIGLDTFGPFAEEEGLSGEADGTAEGGRDRYRKIVEKMELDKVNDIALSAKKRQWEICSRGLTVDGEQWTVEDVQALPEIIIEKIAARIEEISRGRPGQVENFRKEQ